MNRSHRLLAIIIALALTACAVRFDVRATVIAVTALPPIGSPPLHTPTPQPLPALSPTPPHTQTPSPEPSFTPTPDPYSPYFVESLRSRVYPGGQIEIVSTVQQTDSYTTYSIAYPSDSLRITGLMNLPNGDGPFPVIILNHGYYDPALYVPGNGTKSAADYFARRGYLTLASDYRDYAGSDPGDDFFRTGYVVDVLNLIASVKTLPQAKADSIGVWGHSMGGGVSLAVAVINPPGLRGVVLYGAMSGDMTANYYRIAWFRGWATPGPDWPAPPEAAPEAYAQLSPINYLQYVSSPIRVHHGYLDDQVPYDWSLRLDTALKLAGKDSELYNYPNAGHSFIDADWNLFMERCGEFFEEAAR
jgi:dipeptidyl aminopeptidase/acylaminoacyl peptidase